MLTRLFLVKLGFTRITPKGLLSLGRTIVAKMTLDPLYAAILAKITALKAKLDALEVADDAYDFNRGKVERETLMTLVVEVKDGIRELGSYVQAISQGDKTIITNAGFETRKVNEPFGELPAPKVVFADTTLYPGRIDVRWTGVKGRTTYELWISDGDPNDEKSWKLLSITSKVRFSATGLTSLKKYNFRVVARGAAGASSPSIVASALAA